MKILIIGDENDTGKVAELMKQLGNEVTTLDEMPDRGCNL